MIEYTHLSKSVIKIVRRITLPFSHYIRANWRSLIISNDDTNWTINPLYAKEVYKSPNDCKFVWLPNTRHHPLRPTTDYTVLVHTIKSLWIWSRDVGVGIPFRLSSFLRREISYLNVLRVHVLPVTFLPGRVRTGRDYNNIFTLFIFIFNMAWNRDTREFLLDPRNYSWLFHIFFHRTKCITSCHIPVKYNWEIPSKNGWLYDYFNG